MNYRQKYLSACIAALLGSTSPAWAQTAPNLGAAGNFAVLSAPVSGGAVTTSGSTITGNVGSSGAVTLTDSTITGNVVLTGALTNNGSTFSGTTSPLPDQVATDLNAAYTALSQPCTQTFIDAAFTGVNLSVNSGVICFPAAVTFTNSVLTLRGNGPWIFRVGTEAAGALTGKNFSVVMASGGDACDVFWQVNAATTLTTSAFQGTILAGAAITTTGGTFAGRALAKAGVTMTGTVVTGCDAVPPGGALVYKVEERHGHHKDKDHKKCNQGVGNGPEGCDPGKSNHGNPFWSNDERGGKPGYPGRKDGSKK